VDILYFHLVDHRQHHHHSYFTHFPSVWLGLVALSVLWKLRARGSVAAVLGIVFALNGLVHMVLDSVVGDVRWLAPLSDRAFALAAVPALYKPWWLNFLLHWSFLLELSLVAGAFAMWRSLKLSTDAAARPAIHQER
jgi:inner membrane protein